MASPDNPPASRTSGTGGYRYVVVVVLALTYILVSRRDTEEAFHSFSAKLVTCRFLVMRTPRQQAT